MGADVAHRTFEALDAPPRRRQALLSIAEGVWIPIVDFQAHPAPAHRLTVMADDTIRMHGLVKKALLQSLPYAAAVLVLAPRIWRGPARAAVVFCPLFAGLGIVPFAFGNGHGRMANNVRYLLNLVPVLVILSAVALREIAALAGVGAARPDQGARLIHHDRAFAPCPHRHRLNSSNTKSR